VDKKLASECVALLMLFAAFPIISVGTTRGGSAMWWTGLLVLVAGGVLPVLTRYMDHSRDSIRDVGVEFDDRPS
jgi:hypothetical protein